VTQDITVISILSKSVSLPKTRRDKIRAMIQSEPLQKRIMMGAFPIAVAAAGTLLSFWLSGPTPSLGINWDSGSVLGRMQTLPDPWSIQPWNAHFAEYNLYAAGWWLFGHLGLRLIAAVRATQALFFGAAMGVMAELFRRLTTSRAIAAALVLLWATAFANIWLHVTLEDNVVSIALSAITTSYCLEHLESWSSRVSATVGVLMAAALLSSWQTILYLFPVCLAPLVATNVRGRWQRMLHLVRIVGSVIVTIVAWCLFIAATSRLTLRALFGELLSRPTGHWQLQLYDASAQLRTLGIAAYYYTSHSFVLPTHRYALMGGLALAGLLLLAIVGVRAFVRSRDPRLFWLTSSLLVIAISTCWYQEPDYAALKRFDFVPLFLTLALGVAIGRRRLPPFRVVAVVAAVVALQCALAWRAIRAKQRGIPALTSRLSLPHPEQAWYGSDGRSWYSYFVKLREDHPRACRFVLAEPEVIEGEWWLEIPTAMLSELRAPVLIRESQPIRLWRVPIKTVSVQDAREQRLDEPCAYVSPDAQTLLRRGQSASQGSATGDRGGRR
jgi:hypothetical protein